MTPIAPRWRASRSTGSSSSPRRPWSRRTANSWVRKKPRASGEPAASATRSDSRCDPLGLVEPPGDVRPLAAPGERGVRVERLVELERERLEAGVGGLGGGEVAELDEVEDAPVQRERGDLAGADPLGDGHRLVDRGEALGRVLDVEQRGVAAHQGGGERPVVADAARHRHRLGAEPRRPVAGAGEREVLGQAREQPRPQRALGVPERGERLLEPGDVGGVGGDRHVEAPAGAERGAGQDLGVARRPPPPRRTPRGRRARWPASARRRAR